MEWRRGGNQQADHTSGYSSLVEFRQFAHVAAQPKLGLLSERGPGLVVIVLLVWLLLERV